MENILDETNVDYRPIVYSVNLPENKVINGASQNALLTEAQCDELTEPNKFWDGSAVVEVEDSE
jgi:hypothetical protein